jgi:hypothetical protein
MIKKWGRVLVMLSMTLTCSDVWAQSLQDLLRTHQYSEVIEALGAEASGVQAYRVGQAHLQRGSVLRDLADLQARIGAAYYTERDTSADARSTPWTAYYAARYRHAATGQGGTQVLRELVREGSLPSGYAPRARVWMAQARYRNGDDAAARQTWQSLQGRPDPALAADVALAQWQVGDGIPAVECDSGAERPAALRCALWQAIRAEAWDRVLDLQNELLSRNRPADEVAEFEDYSVRFYDPGTLYVLAVADFRQAAAAFGRVSGQQENAARLLGGYSSLLGRDYAAARSALDATSHSYRIVYQAALETETGGPGAAESLWQQARQNEQARVLWAETASPYEAQREAVASYCESQAQSPPEEMQPALRLGRAALSVDRPHIAYQLLDVAYRVSDANDLRVIPPAYVAVFAHAKFRIGRRYSTEVLRHLNALRQEYPVASIVHDLAQGFYVPENTSGNVR